MCQWNYPGTTQQTFAASLACTAHHIYKKDLVVHSVHRYILENCDRQQRSNKFYFYAIFASTRLCKDIFRTSQTRLRLTPALQGYRCIFKHYRSSAINHYRLSCLYVDCWEFPYKWRLFIVPRVLARNVWEADITVVALVGKVGGGCWKIAGAKKPWGASKEMRRERRE